MSYYWTNFGTYTPPNDVTITGLDPQHTSHSILQDIGNHSHPSIDGHIDSSNNPHGSTLTQSTINSTNISNGQLIDTDDLTSNTGKVTTLRSNNIIDNLGGNTTNINGDLAVNVSNSVTFDNKTMSSIRNTLLLTSGTLLNSNINSVLNQPVTNISTPTFSQLQCPTIKTSTINDNASTNSVTVNSLLVDLNSTNNKTLHNKNIDSSTNNITVTNLSLTGSDIGSLLDQPVLKTSNVQHNNLDISGTALFKGPKPSPLPNVPCTYIGYDTLSQARIGLFSDGAGVLGSIVFSDLLQNSQYHCKIAYDGGAEQLQLHVNSSPTPQVTVDTNDGIISGLPLTVTGTKVVAPNNASIHMGLDGGVNAGIEVCAANTGSASSYIDFTRAGAADFRGRIIYSHANDNLVISTQAGSITIAPSGVTSTLSITVPLTTQTSYAAFCRYTLTANVLTTPTTTPGAFVSVTSQALSSIPLSLFNISGNNGVSYAGTASRRFLISYNVTVNTAANTNYTLRVLLNGTTALAQSYAMSHIHTGVTAPNTASCTFIQLLSTGNSLQLEIANTGGTQALLCQYITFSAVQLDF